MVAKIEREKWPFAKRVGHVRISSQGLVQLLTELGEDCHVSAKTKRHNFSSLDDIKENLSLFFGEIEIKLRNGAASSKIDTLVAIEVKLGACATVGVFSNSLETDVRLEGIANKLRPYRIPILGYLTIVPLFLWMAVALLAVWALPSADDPIPSYLPWVSERVNAGIVLAPIVLGVLAFAVAALPPVYYNPRQTFWQRNRDKIALAIIGVIIGVISRPLINWVIEVTAK